MPFLICKKHYKEMVKIDTIAPQYFMENKGYVYILTNPSLGKDYCLVGWF